MKKTYITPSVEVIKVDAISMMASSLNLNESSVDTSQEGVQLGREDKPNTPNLWEQGW